MRKMANLRGHTIVFLGINLDKAGMKTRKQVLHFFKGIWSRQTRRCKDIIGIFKEIDICRYSTSLMTTCHGVSADKSKRFASQILLRRIHNG